MGWRRRLAELEARVAELERRCDVDYSMPSAPSVELRPSARLDVGASSDAPSVPIDDDGDEGRRRWPGVYL